MYYPKSKNNFLAFHGITGYLWSEGLSPSDMVEKLGLNWEQWIKIWDSNFESTYSERCNATDYFTDLIKNDEMFEEQWKLIKEGVTQFTFSERNHPKMYIGKITPIK